MQYVNRLLNLSENRSFFLFGARNTGKSTLLKETFNTTSSLLIDLLDVVHKLIERKTNFLNCEIWH